jgi:Kef-type K+ transport system membrane component KefB
MILGSLMAGGYVILTGPAETGASDIASIGILLLLFSTGLAINFEEFKRLEIASSIVAISGVILPFILGYFAAILFFHDHLIALFVGVALVATSVGVGASILAELRMLRTRIGTLIMGAAVLDDVIGIILMSALVSIAITGSIPLIEIFLLVVLVVLFFLISLTVGIKLCRKLAEKIHLGREDLLLLGLLIVFAFALISQEIGITAIIGAFIAGLVVGQTHFARSLRPHVSLIGGAFFIPIFFVWMGTRFDVSAFMTVGWFALALVLVAIVGKVAGCGAGARAAKFSNEESFAVGVAMMPRAGVELILVKLGLDYGLIGSDIASAILVMVVITTLITPPALWKALRMVKTRKEV